MSDVPEKAKEKLEENAKSIITGARHFFKMEASGGIVLVLAAMLAMIVANSPLYWIYDHILNDVKFHIGFSDKTDETFDFEIKKSVLLWINDGLMAIFFFLIGLEIKRELKEGELSSRDRALLPAVAAVGGMAIPALIYWFINMDNPENLRGWAIPAATDIAFALGVLSLVGSRAPVSLKVLLTAVAVIDDVGAILIIAIFYSHGIVLGPLFVAIAGLAILGVLNWRGISRLAPYIVVGVIVWAAVLNSGIHATLAGVVVALLIPLRDPDNPTLSPVKHLEHALHPWVSFGVLPLFGFANAGVPLGGEEISILFEPVTLGIAAGLFFGKQVGIFIPLVLMIISGICSKPKNTNWFQLYAVSLLCGIGFTMSLFIGGLAFTDVHMQASVRIGVIMGSVFSAVLAYLLLRYGPSRMAEIQKRSATTDRGVRK